MRKTLVGLNAGLKPPKGWTFDERSELLLCPYCKSIDTIDGFSVLGCGDDPTWKQMICDKCNYTVIPAGVTRVASGQMEMFG